ncbi:MAG: hypothetical protein LBE91_16685 [Tannerella sp.]|jgi:hypothetical protein|nr:hypothetical protein [Tannerella sp.]
MKKVFFAICIAVTLTSCGVYRSFDLNLLTFGMTKREVINTVGRPNRVLAERQTQNGYQEILEYNNVYNEYFALEFWNDYLTGYEFLYEDITYVPPMLPPAYYPEYGRPVYIYVPNRPGANRPNYNNRPNYPTQPNKPNKPTQPNKPTYPVSPSRPTTTTPNRPSTPSTERPSNVGRPTGTGTSSGREDTNTTRPSNVSRPAGTNNTSGRSGNSSTQTTRETNSSTQTTTRESNTSTQTTNSSTPTTRESNTNTSRGRN